MTWADSCVESRAVLRAEVNVLQDVLQVPEFLHFAPSSTLLSAGDAGLSKVTVSWQPQFCR